MYLVLLGLAVVPLVYWLVRRAGFYRRFFSDQHLAEVAAALPALRRAALDGIAALEPVELNHRVSSLGLVVVYSIRHDPADSRFIHHISVSLGGGYTPHGVGAYFLPFALRGLGVEPRQVVCGMTPGHIFHSEWTLSPTEEADFAAREVPVIANPRAVWEECVRLRPHLKFKGLPPVRS